MNNTNWSVLGVVVVVLAIVGATTYLGAAGIIAGATVVQLFMTILGALGVVGGVHVSVNAMNKMSTVRALDVVSKPAPEAGTNP